MCLWVSMSFRSVTLGFHCDLEMVPSISNVIFKLLEAKSGGTHMNNDVSRVGAPAMILSMPPRFPLSFRGVALGFHCDYEMFPSVSIAILMFLETKCGEPI